MILKIICPVLSYSYDSFLDLKALIFFDTFSNIFKFHFPIVLPFFFFSPRGLVSVVLLTCSEDECSVQK